MEQLTGTHFKGQTHNSPSSQLSINFPIHIYGMGVWLSQDKIGHAYHVIV